MTLRSCWLYTFVQITVLLCVEKLPVPHKTIYHPLFFFSSDLWLAMSGGNAIKRSQGMALRYTNKRGFSFSFGILRQKKKSTSVWFSITVDEQNNKTHMKIAPRCTNACSDGWSDAQIQIKIYCIKCAHCEAGDLVQYRGWWKRSFG